MTEAKWMREADPKNLLAFLGERAGTRKLRLFACACCRRHWDWVLDTPAATAVEVAEAHADGRATDKKLEAARKEAQATAARFYAEYRQTEGVAPYIAHMHANACAVAATPTGPLTTFGTTATSAANYAAQTYAYEATDSASIINDDWHAPKAAEVAVHAGVFREVFGNPFRPVAFDPTWRTSDVMLLANGIYADRAFDRMPILADALQDAGCDSAALLNHLRDPALLPWERAADAVGPAPVAHVRGCWALDLVLGRE